MSKKLLNLQNLGYYLPDRVIQVKKEKSASILSESVRVCELGLGRVTVLARGSRIVNEDLSGL